MTTTEISRRLNAMETEVTRLRALLGQRLDEIQILRQQCVGSAAVAEEIAELKTEAGIIPIALLEKQAILHAVELKSVSVAAKLLGLGKTTLYRKLQEYGWSDAAQIEDDAMYAAGRIDDRKTTPFNRA